jgi:hypothetical protein
MGVNDGIFILQGVIEKKKQWINQNSPILQGVNSHLPFSLWIKRGYIRQDEYNKKIRILVSSRRSEIRALVS